MTIKKFNTRNIKISTSIQFLALFAIFLLLVNCGSYLISISANAQVETPLASTYQSTHGLCKCVIFRLDDVNSEYLAKVQLSIMNEFISKNQSISLGLIMHRIDSASPIVEKIKEGKQKGLFELDLHGWDHVDYTQLSQEEQLGTLQQANDKMTSIFGQHSQVFIPPYNKFDGDTIGVLRSVGVRIFSADTSTDRASYFVANGVNASRTNLVLYHLPAVTSFKSDNGNGTWIKIPIQTILSEADRNINRYGYAVILLHPQNFAKLENNQFVDITDENEIKDLSSLIDSIKSQNLQITTFANVVGLNEVPISASTPIPEFHGVESIVLLMSTMALIAIITLMKNGLLKYRL